MPAMMRAGRWKSVRNTSAEQSKENFDRHFAVIVSGAERTRGILYFFALVLVVNIVFFFEDAFNTAGRRLDVMNGAVACLAANLDDQAPVPLYGEFFEGHERCGFFYNYLRYYYNLNVPDNDPASIDKTSKQLVFEKYKAVLKDATDFLSTTIPVLNIKIDRNDGLILQNSLAFIVTLVLFFSIGSERKALHTIGQIVGTHRYRIAAILDAHVFIRASSGRKVLWAAIIFPVATQIYRVVQDIGEASVVQDIYGVYKGLFYLVLEGFSLFCVAVIAALCILESMTLNQELLRLGNGAIPPLLVPDERELMNKRLDLLALLMVAAMLTLIAVPVLARVNP